MKSNAMKMLAIILVLPHLTAAQSTADISKYAQDLDVPQSAAFSLLGVTPDKVIDPQTGRDLGVAILNGLDENGNLQTGFAIEVRPYLLLGGEKYVNDGDLLAKNLNRIKLSAATTKGSNDEDSAIRYGVGFNYSYSWNDFSSEANSPTGYIECAKKVKEKTGSLDDFIKQNLSNPEFAKLSFREQKVEWDKYIVNVYKPGVEGCYNKYASWAVTAVSFGSAVHTAKEDSSNVKESGAGAWFTGSIALKAPFVNRSSVAADTELTAHLRIIRGQLGIVDNLLEDSDRDIIAGRLRHGSDKFRGIAEVSYNKEKSLDAKDSFFLWSVGGERKLTEGVWFRLAYGDAIGASEKSEVFSGQLRYAFGDGPSLKYE